MTGQIDSEIADTKELENYLSGRRDSKVDLLNLINLGIGGTLDSASSALGGTVHDRPAAVIGVLAGGAPACRYWSRARSENRRKYCKRRATVKRGLRSSTRLQQHVSVEIGRIPPPDSAEGRQKIEQLTSLPDTTSRSRSANPMIGRPCYTTCAYG